jgi:hypothetical protein
MPDNRFSSEIKAFFHRLQGRDRLRIGDQATILQTPESPKEKDTKRKLLYLQQYVRNKNYNRRHIEFFDEYRRMVATFPIIKAGVDIYAEEACSKNNLGNVINIKTNNAKIKKLLEECFFKNLKLNSRSYLIIRELCKFGNVYGYLITRPRVGVTDIIFLPPEAVIREQMINQQNLDEYRFVWYGGGASYFEPWEIVHWRNIEDIEQEPYGTSILRCIVDTWRRVVLIREALVIYRVTRAPSKLLWKIGTDGMTADEAMAFAQDMKKEVKKKPLVNPETGEIDFRYNPITVEEDVWLPTYEGSPADVTVLEGASNLDAVEDYKIIKDDIFAGLKIPKSWLTFEEDLSNKAALCLNPLTKIDLLDGRKLNLFEIEKELKEKDLWVYTYDKNLNKIIPSKIKWCKQTRKEAKQIRVWLDNDEYIDCTPEHRFILNRGKKIQAQELIEGDSLQTGYKRLKTQLKNGREYEQIYNHKVVKIEWLKEKVDMYDLEVENENHNFLTSAGVFVHNSEEDIRFAKTTQRIQEEYLEGCVHIALVHLFLNGCSEEEMQSFTLEMACSSTGSEKRKQEILGLKIDNATKLWDSTKEGLNLMSYVDVLKTVFKFTEEEIRKTIQSQFTEKKLAWRLSQLRTAGFYDEPDLDKLLAQTKDMTGGMDPTKIDIFNKLGFEGATFKEIVEKKIQKELLEIFGPVPIVSPSKKTISLVESSIKRNLHMVENDLRN